jgi:hypothetical protein
MKISIDFIEECLKIAEKDGQELVNDVANFFINLPKDIDTIEKAFKFLETKCEK